MSEKVTISRAEAEAIKAKDRHEELRKLFKQLDKADVTSPILKEISAKLSAMDKTMAGISLEVAPTDLTPVIKELTKLSAILQHELAKLKVEPPTLRFPDAYEFSFSRDGNGNIKSPITVKTIFNG